MSIINLQDRIRLRAVTDADLAFMRDLYIGTRQSEMAASGLPEAAFKQFLAVQFAAQYQHYMSHYSSRDFAIVEVDGVAIGRFFVDHWKTEIRIVDITLAPHARGQGIGSYLLGLAFTQARERNCPVTIHVDRNNPARRLYTRLGFRVAAERDNIYLLMKWRAED
jgi:ribosomal protein S18 acetylase RimI-like enzyme